MSVKVKVKVKNASEINEINEGKNVSYLNFVNAIRSEATKRGYLISLRRFMIHVNAQNTDELLKNQSSPRLIESQIIDYIMSLRNSGVAYSTIKSLIAPIFTFYQLNDVTLNRKKVMCYTGEYRKVVKDKAYSTQHIQTALQSADSRISNHSKGILQSSFCASLNLHKLIGYSWIKILFFIVDSYHGVSNDIAPVRFSSSGAIFYTLF